LSDLDSLFSLVERGKENYKELLLQRPKHIDNLPQTMAALAGMRPYKFEYGSLTTKEYHFIHSLGYIQVVIVQTWI
jgi:hypothetical protein